MPIFFPLSKLKLKSSKLRLADAHQVFVKMPQRRRPILESAKPLPTPLRRSRRILELQHTQNPTPKNTQVHPISKISPFPSSSAPGSRSNSRTRSTTNRMKQSTVGCLDSGKSANGSSRKSRLNCKFEELGKVRRSPRFCNKIDSESYDCSPLRERGLNQVIRNGSPVTPLGMGENRLRCSELSSGFSISGSKIRVVGCSSRSIGKENRMVGCSSSRIVVCGLACSSTYLSVCSTPGGRMARQRKLEANNGKDAAFEMRVTRSASKRMKEQDDLSRQNVGKRVASTLAMKWKQGGIESSKGASKRVTRSSVAAGSIRLEEEKTSSQGVVRSEKEHCELKLECLDAQDPGSGVVEAERRTVCRDSKLTGKKRKRNEAGLKKGSDQGWTKEQEIALKRAFFAAKPSPHIWKKVAKLVPGKSAQECFDKVHSDNLTPLSNHQRSRAKKPNSPSDLSLSGCNLFKSPATTKSKKTGRKQKSHVARRAVRHLLQKHSKLNHDNGGDLFSVLEPSVDVLQLKAVQSTPEHRSGTPGSSSFKGSSGHKKARSRFSSASKSPLTSPPVLKKVKNMALHEKYIDQLHKREAKRKAQFRRCVNGEEKENNVVVTKDVIRAAKNALVCDAMDAIKKFRHSQANIMNEFSDSEEEVLINEDGDDEIET